MIAQDALLPNDRYVADPRHREDTLRRFGSRHPGTGGQDTVTAPDQLTALRRPQRQSHRSDDQDSPENHLVSKARS